MKADRVLGAVDAPPSSEELVAAVGRGDAFVLGIADKAGSTVLSNDSLQEFHGEYEWLFERIVRAAGRSQR